MTTNRAPLATDSDGRLTVWMAEGFSARSAAPLEMFGVWSSDIGAKHECELRAGGPGTWRDIDHGRAFTMRGQDGWTYLVTRIPIED